MGICFFIFILGFMQNLQAGYRDMIILIDWQNERVSKDLNYPVPTLEPSQSSGFGPVAGSLVTGLAQKAAPILVSSSLWKNFIERKQIFGDFISLDEAKLITKYKNKFVRFSTEDGIRNFRKICKESITSNSFYMKQLYKTNYRAVREMKGFVLPFVTKIDLNEWLIQKITEHWYLLVPKTYLEKINREPFAGRPTHLPASISDNELRLGLKLGQSLQHPFDTTKHNDDPNIAYEDEFLMAIKKLFITINDVRDSSSKEKTEENMVLYLHDWYFYLNGHGSPSSPNIIGVIAGLTIERFQKLLSFFNNKIKTDFLFYTTCYVGGQHLKMPYIKTWYYPLLKPTPQIFKATRSESFNYMIAAETLVYAVTYGWLPSISIPFILGQSYVRYTQYFPVFFKEIKEYIHPPEMKIETWLKLKAEEKKKKYLNLGQILNYITIFLKEETGKIDEKMQIPVVRYPNTAWFSVIDTPEKIFRLTKILAETRAAENKEIVVTDKEALILYAESPFTEKKVDSDYHSEILGTVRIKKEISTMSPTILSNAPGGALHYFEQIKAPKSGIIELLEKFIPPIDELYPRSYYIKKLFCKNDIRSKKQIQALKIADRKQIILENVIFLYNARNPLDKKDLRKLNGIFFTHQSTNFYSFWEPTDMQKIERLKKIEFPGLSKVVEPNFIVPQYPYPLPENRLKVIAELLEKKLTEKKEKKGKFFQLEQEFAYLMQNLKTLNKSLNDLIK